MKDIMGKIKDIVTDSIKFWEIGRLIYNAVLILIVLWYYIAAIIQDIQIDYIGTALGLFIMAVIANMLYCIAYFIDFFVQLSAFQDFWRKYRWVLLAIGMVLASLLACLISDHMFLWAGD